MSFIGIFTFIFHPQLSGGCIPASSSMAIAKAEQPAPSYLYLGQKDPP